MSVNEITPTKEIHAENVRATADKLIGLFGISEKKAKRIAKSFEFGSIEELDDKPVAELENMAAASWIEINAQTEQVENNKGFQDAKEIVKDFNAALKNVTNPLKATLDVCALFIEKKKRG